MEEQIRQLFIHGILLLAVAVFLAVFGKKIGKSLSSRWKHFKNWYLGRKREKYARRLNKKEERMFGRDRKVDGIRRVSSNKKRRRSSSHSKHRRSSGHSSSTRRKV